MGVQPSKTELFLPSQTLRECHPDRCWCDRPYHRSSRYVYVERGGDGRERYQDPVEIMSQFMMGSGSAPQMPWKEPRSWTVRDYEKLGEVMEEWAGREYGKNNSNPTTRGGYPPWPEMQQQQGGGYWDGNYGGRHSSGRRSRRYVPWDQFEDLKSNFQRMAEQYQRHISEQDAFLFGSDTDRRKEQYRQNMLNQLKEMMPQLVQMMSNMPSAQQMPGMPQQPMMPGMGNPLMAGAVPGMQMPGTQGGMPMPMQNPMQAAAAAAMNGMNPMAGMQMGGMPPMAPMMNGGVPMMNNGMMNGMEAPVNMSRRGARRRNGFALDDGGFDDDYEEFRPRRGFGKRRGGNWRDDDDMLGGYAGGMHGPRGPAGGGPSRPPPFRPGDGGLAFDDNVDRMGMSMPEDGYVSAAHPRAHMHTTRPPDRPLAGSQSPFSPPLRRPGYEATNMRAATEVAEARRQNMMQNTAAMYAGGLGPDADPATAASYARAAAGGRPDFAATTGVDYGMPHVGSNPGAAYGLGGMTSGMSADAPYTSAATAAEAGAGPGPSTLRSAMKRNVSFEAAPRESTHLARPREEESARGETCAGAMPGKRDGHHGTL